MIYVYRARGTDLYKIGYTARSAEDRVKEWQAGCPYPLDLIGTIKGTLTQEKRLHGQLKRQGKWKSEAAGVEWFVLNDEDVEQILGGAPRSQAEPVAGFAMEVAEDLARTRINALSRRSGCMGIFGTMVKVFLRRRR